MNLIEQPEVQSRAQREGVFAALTCLLAFGYLCGIVSPAVELLPWSWLQTLVYVLLPLVLTFTLLESSSIHREMARMKRAAYLFGASILIFAGTALLIGAVTFFATIFQHLGRGQPGH